MYEIAAYISDWMNSLGYRAIVVVFILVPIPVFCIVSLTGLFTGGKKTKKRPSR